MQNNTSSILEELGWDRHFDDEFKTLARPGLAAARIISQSKYSYRVCGEKGEMPASLAGRILHNSRAGDISPTVGDWVAVRLDATGRKAVIEAILPRKGSFSRKVPGSRTEEQVLVTNINLVFIVSGLDGGRNLNLRRIERYLILTWDSGASPVMVLNKADLCTDTDISECVNDIEDVALGAPVHVVSAVERQGLDKLKEHFVQGTTAVFLGPSGVGKSSIINALLGEDRLRVGEVRDLDRRGRHTTSHRELFLLPGGGVVIDTPGIREIQLWADEDALYDTFPDIEQLALECRFTDCTHISEPGCAVRKAIKEKGLSEERFQSYLKLMKEIDYLEIHQKNKSSLEEKAKWKKISQLQKQFKKKNLNR